MHLDIIELRQTGNRMIKRHLSQIYNVDSHIRLLLDPVVSCDDSNLQPTLKYRNLRLYQAFKFVICVHKTIH